MLLQCSWLLFLRDLRDFSKTYTCLFGKNHYTKLSYLLDYYIFYTRQKLHFKINLFILSDFDFDADSNSNLSIFILFDEQTRLRIM